MLNDGEIRHQLNAGGIAITPEPPDNCLQPASVDLHLGRKFFYPRPPHPRVREEIDPTADNSQFFQEAHGEAPFKLQPLSFCNGVTAERIRVGAHLACRIEGKSSVARLGLLVHCTAGFVDPGWDGPLTLEFFNAMNRPFVLWPGMKICQLSFALLEHPAHRPYGHPDLGSKYTNNPDDAPVLSEYHRNERQSP